MAGDELPDVWLTKGRHASDLCRCWPDSGQQTSIKEDAEWADSCRGRIYRWYV